MLNGRNAVAAVIVVAVWLSPGQAWATQGWIFSASAMGFMNSTTQGGQGPSGSTILTQHELVFTKKFWGLGIFGQYDRQGANETDTALGPKVELQWRTFFAEFGYAFLMTRAFTDRAIAKQTGSGMTFGIGVRVPLKGAVAAKSKGPFLQFSYKYRIQNISAQDGTDLSEPITQTDGYPLFGLGYDF